MEDVTNIIMDQREMQIDVPIFVCDDCSFVIDYLTLIIFAYAFVGYLLWEWNRYD